MQCSAKPPQEKVRLIEKNMMAVSTVSFTKIVKKYIERQVFVLRTSCRTIIQLIIMKHLPKEC